MKTLMLTEDIPSNMSDFLNSLVGRKLERLVRYSWCSEDEAVDEFEIDKKDVFSLTAGPVLMYFEDGLVVGAASNPSLNSVILWVEKNEDGDSISEPTESDDELFPVDAKSQGGFWSHVLGQSMVALKIVHRAANSAKMAELPNQVGLLIVLDDGSEFILSHGLHDNSDDFSVIKRDQISDELLNQLGHF